jgi:hypothetical protein
MTVFVTLAAALALLVWSVYTFVSSIRWDSAEVRELEKLELQLAHILQLLEAPDVQILLREESSRQDLLLEFSSCLKEDVVKLMSTGGLRISSLLFAGIFLLSYYLIRLKAKLVSGRNDLQFLSRIELALFRSMK